MLMKLDVRSFNQWPCFTTFAAQRHDGVLNLNLAALLRKQGSGQQLLRASKAEQKL